MNQQDTLHDPSTMEVEAVTRLLDTDADRGLTVQEAARRLAADGPNELRAAPPVPTWRRILAQFQDPLIYLLLAAVGISLVAWWIEGRTACPVDAIVIALIVVMNAVLGYVQEAKAQDAVAALARMTAVTSAVVRDGQVKRMPSAELVRGDLLVLGEGDAVGADARLVQAASLRVQEASLTGESEAVLKDAADAAGPGSRSATASTWCSRERPSCRAPAAPSSPRPACAPRWARSRDLLEATEEEPHAAAARKWRASGACSASRSS